MKQTATPALPLQSGVKNCCMGIIFLCSCRRFCFHVVWGFWHPPRKPNNSERSLLGLVFHSTTCITRFLFGWNVRGLYFRCVQKCRCLTTFFYCYVCRRRNGTTDDGIFPQMFRRRLFHVSFCAKYCRRTLCMRQNTFVASSCLPLWDTKHNCMKLMCIICRVQWQTSRHPARFLLCSKRKLRIFSVLCSMFL